jgi:hypothetical protein
MPASLYGLNKSNRDFGLPSAWGKNVFTNSFPVALAQYMHNREIAPVLISAVHTPARRLSTEQRECSFDEIFNVDPLEARFLFETSFEPHSAYTRGSPEKSDVVVADASGQHRRALEIKLTTVPDSASAHKPHDQQACELVARPLMIEQLAVTICASYGPARKSVLNELLNEALVHPASMPWGDEEKMRSRWPQVLKAARDIITRGLRFQTPMVLHPVWRTVGTTPAMEDACFDIFVWTDLALASLFVESSDALGAHISRPQRSVIWLIKMLWDYSIQGSLDRADTFESITFNAQTDKAASFSGLKTIKYLGGPYLSSPRVRSSAVSDIILGGGAEYLAPERRLDAALYVQLIKDGARPTVA